MHHSVIEAVGRGTLGNLMVCLEVWMSDSGHTLTDKMMARLLPIGMFVASGFEHSIANMFLIPLAILIRDFAPDSFWTAVHSSADNFPALTVSHFITANLIPVTIGNIIGGGLLVGVTYWIIYLRNQNSGHRSEERRVGLACRLLWSPDH